MCECIQPFRRHYQAGEQLGIRQLKHKISLQHHTIFKRTYFNHYLLWDVSPSTNDLIKCFVCYCCIVFTPGILSQQDFCLCQIRGLKKETTEWCQRPFLWNYWSIYTSMQQDIRGRILLGMGSLALIQSPNNLLALQLEITL